MGKSRLQMRREVEAAEEAEPASKAKATKKKATRKKAAARKTREKAPERKRVVWVLYSSSMKEEGRFSYDQNLRLKSWPPKAMMSSRTTLRWPPMRAPKTPTLTPKLRKMMMTSRKPTTMKTTTNSRR